MTEVVTNSDISTKQHPLFQEQLELEKSMVHDGVENFRYRVAKAVRKGQGATSGGALRLLQAIVDSTEKAIKEFIEQAQSGKAGRRHTTVNFIKNMPPDKLAYITAKTCLDMALSGKIRIQSLTTAIGSNIALEAEVGNYIAQEGKRGAGFIRQQLKRTGNARHLKGAVGSVMSRAGVQRLNWSIKDKHLIGMKLFELLNTYGVFEVQTHTQGTRTKRPDTIINILLKPEISQWINDRNLKEELLRPTTLPMVVPPKKWTTLFSGGYWLNDYPRPFSFIKTSRKILETQYKDADLSNVMTAVNAVQETPWRINQQVLGVLTEIWDNSLDLAGTPPLQDPELPNKPHDIEHNQEAKNAWKRDAHAVYEARMTLISKRRQFVEILKIAEQFKQYAAIYFPHNCDFRGRIYAIPKFLNPQGADYVKGLLTFTEGHSIDNHESAEWLAIHGANCYGADKVSFYDRVLFIHEYEDYILDAAKDPLRNLWWTKASSPFCFLAFCFEWAGYKQQGFGFKSHLPIALDGTCNGLQHYSAIMRDEIGGSATNLIPSQTPQDIYAEVAKVVTQRLEELAQAPDTKVEDAIIASKWAAFGIDRTITKRPVMVLPYGGTRLSCLEYTDAALKKHLKEGKALPFSTEEFNRASCFLGGVVWQSISNVVGSAKIAMRWLRDSAGVACKSKLPLIWVTPSGFKVYQAYREQKGQRIRTHMYGAFISLQLKAPCSALDNHKQTAAFPPNFIHSMDAAALIVTTNNLYNVGLRSFAMVHDSYGVHAAHASVLSKIIRFSFTTMYTAFSPLQEFKNSAPPEVQNNLPPLPPQGSLDIEQVLNSEYFFA